MVIYCFPFVFLWFCYISGVALFSYGFAMFLIDFKSSALARSSVILWFPMVKYGFHGFLIFPIDFNRRPLPDLKFICWYPIVFLRFSHVFAMFLVDFNRRPDLWLSYDFLWFCMVSFVFDMFPIDFNRRPSPDLRLSYVFPWFSFSFPMFLICLRLNLIVGPRPTFDYLMISNGFVILFLWICYFSNWF